MKQKTLTKEERLSRIIARGEFSGHSHIITGDVEVIQKDEKTFIIINDDQNAVLKHLFENDWMVGVEKWTGEHNDISLAGMPQQVRHGDVLLEKISDTSYQFIQQNQFSPYDKLIVQNRD